MEISEYDEYIPEKELDVNFRIPRRKPEETSKAMQGINPNVPYYAQARQLAPPPPPPSNPQRNSVYGQSNRELGQYAHLSGAANQASAHSNSKPPISYGPPPEIEFARRSALPPGNIRSSSLAAGNSLQSSFNLKAAINSAPNLPMRRNLEQNPSFRRNQNNMYRNDNFQRDLDRRSMDDWSVNHRGYNADRRDFGADERDGNFRQFSFDRNPSRGRDWDDDRPGNWDDDYHPSTRDDDFHRRTRDDDYQPRDFVDGPPSFPRFSLKRGLNADFGDDRDDDYEPRDFVDGPPPLRSRRGGFFGMNRGQNMDRGFLAQGNGSSNYLGISGNQQGIWSDRGYRNEEYEDEQNFSDNRRNSRGIGRGAFRGASRGREFGGKRTYGDSFRNKGNPGPPPKREKPKTYAERTPVHIKDLADKTLPQELREKFQPLYCKLCALQMNSNIMAKLHYSSKNHEKKIRKFLIEHAEKNGGPVHPRAIVAATPEIKENDEDKNPKYFHCDICDLPLTGKLHAESHYMGKNHNAVVMGRKAPHGKGHYDADGKWVRDQTEKAPLADISEGDNIGLEFRKKGLDGVVEDKEGSAEEKAPLGEFTCSICMVTCTAQEQMNMHFSGAKHRKKLKAMGVTPEHFTLAKEDKEGSASEDGQSNEDGAERNDFSKYKTPSGHYYCGKCNLTLNSEVQCKDHLVSKNHMKKSNILKESASVK